MRTPLAILAEALVKQVLGEDAEIVSTCKEKRSSAWNTSRCLRYPYFNGKKGYRVVADEYVSLEEGTGIVHIAPAFGGAGDSRVGKSGRLPFVQLVNASGHMTSGTPWDGLFVRAFNPSSPRSKRAENTTWLSPLSTATHSVGDATPR